MSRRLLATSLAALLVRKERVRVDKHQHCLGGAHEHVHTCACMLVWLPGRRNGLARQTILKSSGLYNYSALDYS